MVLFPPPHLKQIAPLNFNIDTQNWPCLKGVTFSKPWCFGSQFANVRGCNVVKLNHFPNLKNKMTKAFPRHPGPPPQVRYLDPRKHTSIKRLLRRYDWMSIGRWNHLGGSPFTYCYCWWFRNLAPVRRYFILLFTGVYISQVVRDFFHQQYICCYLFKLYLIISHEKIGISRWFPSTKVSCLMTRFPWILGIAVKLIGTSWSNCHGYFFIVCFIYIISLYTLPETNSKSLKNQWLEEQFRFGMAYFQGLC